MELNVKESLSQFVVEVLLFQSSIQLQGADLQLVKEGLVEAALCCEAAYIDLQETSTAIRFKKAIKVCLDELQQANYWLRILKEAKIGNKEKVELLLKESNWIKGNLEQVRNTTQKRLIPAQGVAA